MPFLLADVSGGSDVSGMSIDISNVDLIIIAVYMVGIVALGCWAGIRQRRDAEGSDYFLAGRSLRWPVIGLALFATNISTIHLVSLAEAGYKSGLLYGNFEWMAGFTLVLLALFFAPFYIRSKVATLPEFMEKRYSRGNRDLLVALSIFSAVAVHISFSLFTGALVLEQCVLPGFFEKPADFRLWTIIIMAGATALYTIIGGLLAVVVTESIQTIILLVGAICITLLALFTLGQTGDSGGFWVTEGWQALKDNVHPNNVSMLRPMEDPTGISMIAVFAGYWITGIWYWCTDQTIVQRVLGARDEHNARVGPLFAGFIKILPVFIFVLPGLLCLALVNTETIPPLLHGSSGQPDFGATYGHMINHILPWGVRGIVVAALLAALMSTVAGALNSIATLFSYDIYKRWYPETNDHSLVRIGRIATFVAMIVAIVWSMLIGLLGKGIFQAMVDIFPAVAPPTTVVFFWGVFWKKASAKAALITLFTGFVVGGVVSVLCMLKFNQTADGYIINALLLCAILAAFESVLLIVCSYIFPHKHTEESEKLVWKHPWEALTGTKFAGITDFRIWTGILLITMVGLYWSFAGETYYPITGKVTLADGTTPVAGAILEFEVVSDKTDLHKSIHQFSVISSGEEGNYAYATDAASAGAPVGTKFKIRILPGKRLVSESIVNGETVRQVIGLPPKAFIDYENSKNLKDKTKLLIVKRSARKKGEDKSKGPKYAVTFLVSTKNGEKYSMENVEIPAKYQDFETSGLEVTFEAAINKKNIELK